MTATVHQLPASYRAMARGRFARNAVAQMGGDAWEQFAAQVHAAFDDEARADMLKERNHDRQHQQSHALARPR